MKNKIIIISAVLVVFILGIFIFINSKRKLDIGFKVPNYYSITSAFYEDKKGIFEEKYNWYKEIENNNGVYLINTTYFSNEMLKEYKRYNVYNNIPLKAFWYFTVSPNYLQIMNVNVSSELIEKAKNGVRVFLIPDTYSKEEISMMKSYLNEIADRAFNPDSVRKPEDTIKTSFYENPEVDFASYTPNKEYFTFPSTNNVSLIEKEPIIFICTTNNMIYFESESLFATGINSYIRFKDKKTLNQYKNDEVLNKYNVDFEKLSGIYKINGRFGVVDKGIYNVFKD